MFLFIYLFIIIIYFHMCFVLSSLWFTLGKYSFIFFCFLGMLNPVKFAQDSCKVLVSEKRFQMGKVAKLFLTNS